MEAAGRKQRMGLRWMVWRYSKPTRYVVSWPPSSRVFEQLLARVKAIQASGRCADARAPDEHGRAADRDRRRGRWIATDRRREQCLGRPGLLQTLQIPILYGRALDAQIAARPAPQSSTKGWRAATSAASTRSACNFRISRRRPVDDGRRRRHDVDNDLGDIVDPVPYMFFRSIEQWGVMPTTVWRARRSATPRWFLRCRPGCGT